MVVEPAGAGRSGPLGPRLAAVASHAPQAAVLTDFDGTLAPVVDDPYGARPLPGASSVLASLAERYRRVAVVSGRPVAFLVEHLGLEGRGREGGRGAFPMAYGLYGLEWADGDGLHVHPEAPHWRSEVGAAAERAEAAHPAGVIVENKGLAVTLHWRTAEGQAGWARAFAKAEAEGRGLVCHPGRKSVELRPPVGADKGSVVEALCEGLEAACFFGDDRGDVPAFDALTRLASGGSFVACRVAVRSPEMPSQLADAADTVVDGPGGALAALRAMA